MAQAQTHPLLSLQDDEIIHKLREMTLDEILKFSFISEKCKDLVSSLHIKGTSFRVIIGSGINVHISTCSKVLTLSCYCEEDMYWGMGAYGRKKKLTPPQSAYIRVLGEGLFENTWNNSDLEIQCLLEHLQDIFNYHKIDYICFSEDSSQFDIDDIKEVFGNTSDVRIENTGCYLFNKMILQNDFPIEKLFFRASDFPSFKIPKEVLIQNFSKLHIGHQMGETRSMTLDELLLINSKVVTVDNLRILPKQINKFFKLWQKGSNPHMEFLSIHCFDGEEEGEQTVMKGIKHQLNQLDLVRNFKSVGLEDLKKVRLGKDVYRMDGVKATIRHRKIRRFSLWEMYVWFDHCVVDS